jgi:hypothetical protein
MRLALPFLVVCGLGAGGAAGQDFSGGFYADARFTADSRQLAATDGGLGKFRYGGDQADFRLADVNLYGTAQLSEDLLFYGDLNWDPKQRSFLDLDEAYLRYRPLSLSPWRFSLKLGAFFPPVSLENGGPGWSSVWTLTPSAINSWVGEELRTIGGEGKVEWRGEGQHVEAMFALYGYNDPAGVLLADRGWALTDRVTGLFDNLRLPNALASGARPGPFWRQPFNEIDGRPGLYGGLDWRAEGWGHVNLICYDNRADPHAYSGEFAWRTGFVGLGAETEIDGITVMTQAMQGKTVVNPFGNEGYATHFQSAFLLLGYRYEEWRIALRGEAFATESLDDDPGARLSEHGSAMTLALTWKPLPHLRLTAEGIVADSWRTQRLAAGDSPGQTDRQLQLNARLYY